MTFKPLRYVLLAALLTLTVSTAAAEDNIRTAYAKIMAGDYAAGQEVVARLLDDEDASTPQTTRVDKWLKQYQQVVAERGELREKTLVWNLENAEQALKSDNEFLALSFIAQGLPYAEDEDAYRALDVVQRVRDAALKEGKALLDQREWTKAHSHFVLLQRVFADDKEVKAHRERAARHVRLAVIYEESEEVQRRIKDVTSNMLRDTISLIEDHYYRRPDFKDMAMGALDNLLVMAQTPELWEGLDAPAEFDSLADPVAREHFVSKLTDLRNSVERDPLYTANELSRLYLAVDRANRESISLPRELVIVEFTEGALGELDDYTSIIWPADAAEFDKIMRGNFVGVGIQLGVDELSNRLKVVTPLENSPALEAGIQPEDVIRRVNGESTKGWTTDDAVRNITGQEGTQVTLTIFRPRTGETLDFPLKRRPIEITTIRGIKRIEGQPNGWDYMLDKEIGAAYIQLTNFNPSSGEELRQALAVAQEQGMRGLILDLRQNPGGMLDVAIDTVSAFLPRGKVVETKGRSEDLQRLTVNGNTAYPSLPLVVLVNEYSASASEILAGALKDHERAVVLGERTFGKGSVQRVFSLSGGGFFSRRTGAQLKLTTALYYLPDGKSPHKAEGADRWGVEPNWSVKLTPKEFGKVLDLQRERYIIHNEDKTAEELDESSRESALKQLADATNDDEEDEDRLLSEADIEALRADPYEAAAVDPQLETALLHLRVKLAGNLPWPPQIASQAKSQP